MNSFFEAADAETYNCDAQPYNCDAQTYNCDQWWAFCSEKGRGRVVRVFKSEFQIHEIGIVPNLWLFRPSDI